VPQPAPGGLDVVGRSRDASAAANRPWRDEMSTNTLLLIILILLLIGALPLWPYSSGWGYYPSGGLGLLLIILLVVFLVRGA
jgi:polyferredoxin